MLKHISNLFNTDLGLFLRVAYKSKLTKQKYSPIDLKISPNGEKYSKSLEKLPNLVTLFG